MKKLAGRDAKTREISLKELLAGCHA